MIRTVTKPLALLAALAVFTGCKDKAEKTEAAAETPAKPEVHLYALDGGTVQVNNLEIFAQDSVYRGESTTFADAYYVIVHPKGTLMWDAGLPEALVGLPEPFTSPDGNFTVSRPDSVAAQLAAIGLSPEDIDYLSLSHTHFDHSGHAESVPNATWLVQDTEYAWISSPEMEAAQPDMFNAVNDLSKVQQISGDFDVFGDGSVMIKAMPGHTPGHSALYVDLAENGPVLLSGDLYHLKENRLHKRVPVFNTDVDQTLASMEAFEAFADSTGAKVTLQHSKEDFESMPKAPEFLK